MDCRTSRSTKNAAQKRDPEMSSSKKGNQWYFGMKAHVGVDAESGLVHTADVTTGKGDLRSVMLNQISIPELDGPHRARRYGIGEAGQ